LRKNPSNFDEVSSKMKKTASKYGRTAHGVGVKCSKNKLKIRGEGKNTVSEDSFSTSC